jgi:hypothetical protein
MWIDRNFCGYPSVSILVSFLGIVLSKLHHFNIFYHSELNKLKFPAPTRWIEKSLLNQTFPRKTLRPPILIVHEYEDKAIGLRFTDNITKMLAV